MIRFLTTYRLTRWLLNFWYLRLNYKQLADFHTRYALIHREHYDLSLESERLNIQNGVWRVRFLDKIIKLPITKDRIWLDWDLALSVIGHDTDIKETYKNLKVGMFIDIGANYGTHSLLFLTQGIPTLTFEPNLSCHAYFEEVCKLNNVKSQLEPFALGNKKGEVELSYPERNTWLGATNQTTIKDLKQYIELTTQKVKMRKLDEYYLIFQGKMLIKIDTEGNELEVLQGAEQTIKIHQPFILFEVWHDREQRERLYKFFDERNYKIYSLPYPKNTALLPEVFYGFANTNFIAVPKNA